jgi:magnesium chelatase family protein
VTVSLAPADLPKESGRFDLPIALGILAASGHIDATRLEAFEFAGELSLGGELRPGARRTGRGVGPASHRYLDRARPHPGSA